MTEHVRRPSSGSAVHGPDLTDRAAGDDFLHSRVVLAVPVLVADDRLDARALERLFDREPLRAAHRHRLLECDELRPASDPELDERQSYAGRRAEAEDVGLHLAGERRRIGTRPDRSELRGRGGQPLWIPAADAGQLEPGIGSERRGMVHAALAHAHDDDAVGHYFGALSHSRTLEMT